MNILHLLLFYISTHFSLMASLYRSPNTLHKLKFQHKIQRNLSIPVAVFELITRYDQYM